MVENEDIGLLVNYKLCREFVVGENELIILMNLPISVVNSNRVIPLFKLSKTKGWYRALCTPVYHSFFVRRRYSMNNLIKVGVGVIVLHEGKILLGKRVIRA